MLVASFIKVKMLLVAGCLLTLPWASSSEAHLENSIVHECSQEDSSCSLHLLQRNAYSRVAVADSAAAQPSAVHDTPAAENVQTSHDQPPQWEAPDFRELHLDVDQCVSSEGKEDCSINMLQRNSFKRAAGNGTGNKSNVSNVTEEISQELAEFPNQSIAMIQTGTESESESEMEFGSEKTERINATLLAAHKAAAAAKVCGTRPLFPQLQFDLELYRHFGVVDAKFAHCAVPSLPSIDMSAPTPKFSDFGRFNPAASHFTWQERRSRAAHGIVGVFVLLTLLTVGYSVGAMVSAKVAAVEGKGGDMKMLQAVSKLSTFDFTGGTLAWLEPVVGRYGWANANQIDVSELNKKVTLDPMMDAFEAFNKVWDEEVESNGQDVDLLRVTRTFVGRKAMMWIIFATGVAMLLELAAMTVGLDMVLNFAPVARSLGHWNVFAQNVDMIQLVVIFIFLCFAVPVTARAFNNMAALRDTHYTKQIISGLIGMVYRKSHRLLSNSGVEFQELQHNTQLLTSDIRRQWAGALIRCAHSIHAPICVAILVSYMIFNIGSPALFGALSTIWIGLLCVPIQHYATRGNLQWGQFASSRFGLMQETILNVQAVKAASWERPLSERIHTCREEELNTKFHFSMVQTFLEMPISLFPYLLIISSLLFSYCLHGVVFPQEIFVSMQVLAGLARFTPMLIASLQGSADLTTCAERVQNFIETPEKIKKEAVEDAVTETDPTLETFPNKATKGVKVTGTFAMSEESAPVLKDLDFQVKPGELVAVVGEVASGKSALLSAIRGELTSPGDIGSVEAPKDLVFCSQEPRVLDGSMEDNVANGEPEDQKRFFEAVDSAFELTGWPDITGTEPQKEAKVAEEKVKEEVADDFDSKTTEGFPYLEVWRVCTIFVLILSVANINWSTTPVILGVFIAVVQGLLHWSVLEFPIKTVATMATPRIAPKEVDSEQGTTVILNYNLLAMSQADVDECMQNMLEAYLNNLNENVAAVLISATNDPVLQEYEEQVRNEHRAWLYRQLFRSGLQWAGYAQGEDPKSAWQKQVWAKYADIEKLEFVQKHLHIICERYAREYMVLHRTSRVLRKCGQYQDLILLSSGEDKSFTYCDTTRYGPAARVEGEPLFRPSQDSENMLGRKFDYTLVLDSDTRVEKGSVKKLLRVALAHPEKAIVQPGIKFYCGEKDPIFMQIEAMRQRLYEPMYDSIATSLGKSSFFGKGLIKNSEYARCCLGTRDNLIESVPIDVLSHDTFEAAVSEVMYCNSVQLFEAPPQTYITWDIRERRWNLGEFILAGYFWPSFVGRPMHWLQSWLQGKKLLRKQIRTRTKLDGPAAYLAHAAMRQIIMKPCLLVYLIVMHFVEMHWKWLSFCIVMFLVIVFPKFAIITRHNRKEVMLETIASIMQFTPEAIVGTIRVVSALLAHLVGKVSWTPQRSVEEESKASNPFVFSLRYLWYYSVLALFWTTRVVSLWWPDVGAEIIFICTILGTLFLLPLYAGFTSLRADTFGSFFFEGSTDLDVERNQSLDALFENCEEEQEVEPAPEVVVEADLLAKVNALASELELDKKPYGKHAWKASLAKAKAVSNSGLTPADRTCIAMARAAYSNSELVLLDDPFGSVDVGVGTHLLEKVIQGPLMRDRTRIVAMHPRSSYLEHFDRIVVLSEGRIVAQGAPKKVFNTNSFQQLLPPVGKGSTDIIPKGLSNWRAESYQRLSSDGPLVPRPTEKKERKKLSQQTTQSIEGFLEGEVADAPFDFMDEVQRPLRWATLRDIVRDGGFGRLCLALTSLVLLRLSLQGQMILLGRWADRAQEGEETSTKHIVLLSHLVLLACICHVTQGYAIQAFSTDASRQLFKRVFASVMQAPLDGFWNLKPATRVTGFLSNAILNMDAQLAGSSFAVAGVIVDIIVQQVFCFFLLPMWVKAPTYLVVLVLCGFFSNATWHLQLFSHMALVKCQEERLQLKCPHHSTEYQRKLADHLNSYAGIVTLPDALCSYLKTWAVSRITFCLCFQCTLCVLVGVLRPDKINIEALVMVMTSTFYIVIQIEPLMKSMGNALAVGISVQQLADYSSLPQDAPEQLPGDEVKHKRLLMDGITLRLEGLYAGYGQGRDIIMNFNVDVPRRSKSVFAGPPCSGKSTVFYCILHTLEQRAGRVLISGADTMDVGVLTLRRLIGHVPQDPVIFQGTIRFNIDPLNQYPDETVWRAVKAAQLFSTVSSFKTGINHVLTEEGSNLSRGQKALINYARAICMQPALLLLDDCLSNLDTRTRKAVQEDINASFTNSTIIAATREPEHFGSFDQLVVIDKGAVTWTGPVRDYFKQ